MLLLQPEMFSKLATRGCEQRFRCLLNQQRNAADSLPLLPQCEAPASPQLRLCELRMGDARHSLEEPGLKDIRRRPHLRQQTVHIQGMRL